MSAADVEDALAVFVERYQQKRDVTRVEVTGLFLRDSDVLMREG